MTRIIYVSFLAGILQKGCAPFIATYEMGHDGNLSYYWGC